MWNYLSCIFPHNLTLNPYGSTPSLTLFFFWIFFVILALVKWGWGIATLFTIIISCNQILYIYVVRWYVRVRKCKQEEVKRNKKKKFHKTSPFFCVFWRTNIFLLETDIEHFPGRSAHHPWWSGKRFNFPQMFTGSIPPGRKDVFYRLKKFEDLQNWT